VWVLFSSFFSTLHSPLSILYISLLIFLGSHTFHNDFFASFFENEIRCFPLCGCHFNCSGCRLLCVGSTIVCVFLTLLRSNANFIFSHISSNVQINHIFCFCFFLESGHPFDAPFWATMLVLGATIPMSAAITYMDHLLHRRVISPSHSQFPLIIFFSLYPFFEYMRN
jgi:hypothetical protein